MPFIDRRPSTFSRCRQPTSVLPVPLSPITAIPTRCSPSSCHRATHRLFLRSNRIFRYSIIVDNHKLISFAIIVSTMCENLSESRVGLQFFILYLFEYPVPLLLICVIQGDNRARILLNLFYLMSNEVSHYLDTLLIFLVGMKLTCQGVTMLHDLRTFVTLSQNCVICDNFVDHSNVCRVWVPLLAIRNYESFW